MRYRGTYTFVIVNCHRQLECRYCRQKHHCKHVELVQTSLAEGDPELAEFQELLDYDGFATINIPVLLSKQKINFCAKKVPCSVEKLFPDVTGLCEQGHPWSPDDPTQKNWVEVKCPCYFLDKIVEVTVYHRLCSVESCTQKKLYDGCGDSLLNMKQFLIDHAVLRDYMRMYLICG